MTVILPQLTKNALGRARDPVTDPPQNTLTPRTNGLLSSLIPAPEAKQKRRLSSPSRSSSPLNMSSPEASPSRGISTWWKQLKKHGSSSESFSSSNNNNNKIDDFLTPRSGPPQNLPHRPTLNFKSRSYNSVRPGNSIANVGSSSEQLIRQQRDEFIASQKRFGFGNEVFGVPLEDSINIAESLISVPSDDPGDFIRYGRIPLLVGKCGSFLKEKGLRVEGIFRVAGSSKRVKELQYLFSTPPEYGRKLNWEGYTVHDAASLFRRFLNNLPEPLVPLALYEQFREPVKSRPRIVNHIKARNDTIERRIHQIQQQQQEGRTPDEDDHESEKGLTTEQIEAKRQKELRKQKKIAKDLRAALKEYKLLIDKLPEAQKHLLYYLLDLLTMFSDNSRSNLMSARNLAAIFQPSILSHPNHDLTPEEYALSQAVVEVLIEYSKRLLPDVKKFQNDSQGTLTTSAKNSSFNLLGLNTESSAARTRPHSRSLSAAGGVPDGINIQGYSRPLNKHGMASETTLSQTKSQEDCFTTDDDDYHSLPEASDLPEPPSTTSPPTTSQPIDIPKPNNTTVPEVSISPPQISQRPVSMFPGSIPTNFDREGRSTAKSPPSGDDYLSANKKKENWFKRLTSPQRNKHYD